MLKGDPPKTVNSTPTSTPNNHSSPNISKIIIQKDIFFENLVGLHRDVLESISEPNLKDAFKKTFFDFYKKFFKGVDQLKNYDEFHQQTSDFNSE